MKAALAPFNVEIVQQSQTVRKFAAVIPVDCGNPAIAEISLQVMSHVIEIIEETISICQHLRLSVDKDISIEIIDDQSRANFNLQKFAAWPALLCCVQFISSAAQGSSPTLDMLNYAYCCRWDICFGKQ